MNIIVAITNFPSIFPIYRSLVQNDFITSACLVFVSTASFVSHLIENHKHGMTSMVSTQTSYLWNRVDVLGSMMIIVRLCYLHYHKYKLDVNIIVKNKSTFAMLLMPILFLRISEYDKYNAKLKNLYVVTHSIWHMSVFASMYYYLDRFIY